VARLAEGLDCPPLLALLLARRGILEVDEAKQFLRPELSHLREPDLLPGMDKASTCIAAAVAAGRRIAVYGDYDVDGICGTALLVGLLRALGADAIPYLPDRRTEGYGFNSDALRHLAAEGVTLVITVDHGSRAFEPVALARTLGMEVVITDHHLVGDGPVPDAAALVNPLAPATDGTPAYPFPWLCGTGVAFKLAWAVARRICGGPRVTAPIRERLTESMALVALATVADVVPLRDENRAAVVFGLSLLRNSPIPGIRALMDVARIGDRAADATDIGFRLAPRINAAGRMGDAGRALELLLTTDTARAVELAAELDAENETRREVERAISAQARAMVLERMRERGGGKVPLAGIVLFGDSWNPGVVGIVAARMAEEFHRPAVVIAMNGDRGRGSARTVGSFHLERALAACGEHLAAHGGHAAAAGLEIERHRLEDFRAAFEAHAEATLLDEDRTPSLTLDALVNPGELTSSLVRSIERLAPFGAGNPEPLLAAGSLRLAGKPRVMGKDGTHLSFIVVDAAGGSRRAVWFGGAARMDELIAEGDALALAFRPSINRFRGSEEVELMVEDIASERRLTEMTAPGAFRSAVP
jgi:single-stranded-DNA-specific exonuclease